MNQASGVPSRAPRAQADRDIRASSPAPGAAGHGRHPGPAGCPIRDLWRKNRPEGVGGEYAAAQDVTRRSWSSACGCRPRKDGRAPWGTHHGGVGGDEEHGDRNSTGVSRAYCPRLFRRRAAVTWEKRVIGRSPPPSPAPRPAARPGRCVGPSRRGPGCATPPRPAG